MTPDIAVKDDTDYGNKTTKILERLEKTELLEDQLALQMQQMQVVQQQLLIKQQRRQQRHFEASMTSLPENDVGNEEKANDENEEDRTAKIPMKPEFESRKEEMKSEFELKREESSKGDQSLWPRPPGSTEASDSCAPSTCTLASEAVVISSDP